MESPPVSIKVLLEHEFCVFTDCCGPLSSEDKQTDSQGPRVRGASMQGAGLGSQRAEGLYSLCPLNSFPCLVILFYFRTGSHFVAQASLELALLWHVARHHYWLSFKSLLLRQVPPAQVILSCLVALRIKPRTGAVPRCQASDPRDLFTEQ